MNIDSSCRRGAPATALQPANLRKRNRPTKASQPKKETGSSLSPSILGKHLQLAQGIQVGMTLEEESIISAISTNDLVEGMAKMLSWSLMVTRTLGDELKRNSAFVMAKLKAKLDESSNSLKSTLEAMGFRLVFRYQTSM